MPGDLQQEIDNQSKDKKIPRGVITLKNMQGSVDLKKNMRHVFIDCDQVTVSSAEEKVEASFINCKQVTISDFKSGVIRFEKCEQIQELTAKMATINASDAKIQKLELTDCKINLFKCEMQEAKFTDCNLHSFNNKYQGEMTLDGGTYYMDKDEIESKVDMKGGATLSGPKLQAKGEFKMEKSSVNLDAPEFKDKFTATESHILITEGQFKGEASIKDKGTCVLNDPEFKDKTTFEDGQFVVTMKDKGEFTDDLTIKNANFTGYDLTCKGKLDVDSEDSGGVVLIKGKYSGEVTAKKTPMRVAEKTEFEDKVTLTDGALDSSDATYKELIIDGGNFTSVRDKAEKITGTKLAGPSVVRSCTEAQEIKLEGEGSSSILLDDLSSVQTLELKKHSTIRMAECSPSELTIEECGSVQIDGGTIQDGTVKKVGIFLTTSTTTVTKLDMEDTQMAVTNAVTDFTVKNSTVIDTESIFTSADASIIIANNSTISTSTGCLINALGGTVTATDASVVTTKGGDITNLDGLTMGTGFDLVKQGGSLMYDGDLNLHAAVGKVKIKSLISDVDVDAAGDINITDGV